MRWIHQRYEAKKRELPFHRLRRETPRSPIRCPALLRPALDRLLGQESVLSKNGFAHLLSDGAKGSFGVCWLQSGSTNSGPLYECHQFSLTQWIAVIRLRTASKGNSPIRGKCSIMRSSSLAYCWANSTNATSVGSP